MSNDALHPRSHRAFDWRANPDLAAAAAYAVVAAVVLALGDGLPPAVRIPVALPLLAFVPGYTAVTALVPAGRDDARAAHGRGVGGIATGLSGLERVTLATVASVAVVPMVALAANVAVGVGLVPVLVGVVVVTLATAAIAAYRRRDARPAAEPHGGPAATSRPSVGDRVGGAIPRDAVAVTAVTIAVVLLAASVAVALAGSPAGGNSAELYLVDDVEGGEFPGGEFPGTLDRGESATIAVGVEHAADEPREYTVVAVLEHVEAGGASRVLSTEELRRTAVTVGPDEPTVREVAVEPDRAGETLRLAFLLYRGDAPADPHRASAHRVVHLPVEVVPGDG